MKIQNTEIDNYIKSGIAQINAALLYGPDQGLASERKDIIIKSILGENFDQMLLSKFESDHLVKNEEILFGEVNNISLIPGRRAIVINNASNNLTKTLKEVIQNSKSDSFILVIGGDLPPASSLRKFFETDKTVASLPCYADDLSAVMRIIREELRNLQPTSEIIQYIAHNLSGNRLIIRQELEKLKLFCSKKNTLEIEDVKNLISENSSSDFQDFANAVADKNSERALKILEHYLSLGLPAITLIRVLINYLQRILEVKSHMQNNQSYFDAIRNLRPPVFFKQKDILKKHTTLWSIAEINVIITKLAELEATCKSTNLAKPDILFKFFTLIITKPKAA